VVSVLEHSTTEGESPVAALISRVFFSIRVGLLESAAPKGGRSHPKLNITGRPIVQKYCEGKVKRTLKRESKVLEIARREPDVTFVGVPIGSGGFYRPSYSGWVVHQRGIGKSYKVRRTC